MHASAQQKKWASRGYRKVDTKVIDYNDPEKNGRLTELIDRKGNVLESWEWNEKDRLVKHVVSNYTKRKFQSTVYSGNDSIRSVEIIDYDQKGRKIRQFFSDKRKGKEEEVIIEYDKWGNKILERLLKNNKLSLVKAFSYNSEGLLIKQINTDADGKITYEKTFQYSK
jgi:hypothetical protein